MNTIDIFGSIAEGPIVVSLDTNEDGQSDIPLITIVAEDSDQGAKKSSSKKRRQQFSDDQYFHDDDLSETSMGESEGTQNHPHVDARERRRLRDQEKRAQLLQDTSSEGVALLIALRERRRERDRLRRLQLKSDSTEEGRLRLEATKERRRESDRRRRLRNQERLSSGEDFYADDDNSSSVSAGVHSATIRSGAGCGDVNKNNKVAVYANFKDAEQYVDDENIEITIS